MLEAYYYSMYTSHKVVEETVDPEKERKSRQQVEKSELRLEKLCTDGSELVSNVIVAEDAREVQYRQEQEDARKARSGCIYMLLVCYSNAHYTVHCIWSLDIHITVWMHVCVCVCMSM